MNDSAVLKQEVALRRVTALFADFERTLNGAASSPAHAQRRDAMARLAEVGFPTMKHEDWKYTNLGPLLDMDFRLPPDAAPATVSAATLDAASRGLEQALRLVLVNGTLVTALSDLSRLPDGVTIEPLGDVLAAADEATLASFDCAEQAGADAFTALNAALLRDGVRIRIARNVRVDLPLHLLFIATAAAAQAVLTPRVHIEAAEGSSATIVEQYIASEAAEYFTNAVSSIAVAANAEIEHVIVQNEDQRASHIASTYARVARDGRYRNRYFGFGSALLRNNVFVSLEGQGGDAVLDGVYVPVGAQHMDHFSVIDHREAHCTSHEQYKGVLADSSRAVFSGRIIVRPGAQKTDAKQANNNLLLSSDALVDARPQLEIYADDVKCTHGATIGRLDEDAMFYLRSRGIAAADAERILSQAFAGEVVGRVPIEGLRERLDDMIHARFDER